MKIVYEDIGSTGVFTTNATTETNLPVENISNPSRSKVMRTTTTADFNIKQSFTDPSYASGFGMFRHNFTSEATIRLRFYDDENQTGSLVYDTGIIDVVSLIGWGIFNWGLPDEWGQSHSSSTDNAFIHFFNAIAFRSLQIDISDSNNGNGFIEIGRVFYGLDDEPTYNMAYGLNFGYKEDTQQLRTSAGTLRSNSAEPYRKVSFELQWLSSSEQLKGVRNTKSAGKTKDILIALYPEGEPDVIQTHTFIGKLTEIPIYTHRYFNIYNTSFSVEES